VKIGTEGGADRRTIAPARDLNQGPRSHDRRGDRLPTGRRRYTTSSQGVRAGIRSPPSNSFDKSCFKPQPDQPDRPDASAAAIGARAMVDCILKVGRQGRHHPVARTPTRMGKREVTQPHHRCLKRRRRGAEEGPPTGCGIQGDAGPTENIRVDVAQDQPGSTRP